MSEDPTAAPTRQRTRGRTARSGRIPYPYASQGKPQRRVQERQRAPAGWLTGGIPFTVSGLPSPATDRSRPPRA